MDSSAVEVIFQDFLREQGTLIQVNLQLIFISLDAYVREETLLCEFGGSE